MSAKMHKLPNCSIN